MSQSLKIIISVVLIAAIAVGGYFAYQHYSATEPTNSNFPEDENNETITPGKEEKEEHKISKYAQMYLNLFDDIMGDDEALNSNAEFVSIDIVSLDKEYANEELKETTRVFYIDDTDVKDIIEYMKKYHNVIKTDSMDELEAQGYMHREGIPYLDGVLVYVSNMEIVREDHFKINMVKYRGGLAAIFKEYEVKFENGEWQFEVIRMAIS